MKFITKIVKLVENKDVNFVLDFTENIKNIGHYQVVENITTYNANKTKTISGSTKSRLGEVECYDKLEKYKIGVNGVTQVTTENVSYQINTINYTTNLLTSKTIFSYVNNYESYDSSGFLTTDEDLIGLIEEPKTVNKIQPNKNFTTALDSTLRMVNLKTISEIEDYGVKFFNINKQ